MLAVGSESTEYNPRPDRDFKLTTVQKSAFLVILTLNVYIILINFDSR